MLNSNIKAFKPKILKERRRSMACMYCNQSGKDHHPDCPTYAPDPERARAEFERGKEAALNGAKYHEIATEDRYFQLGYFKSTAFQKARNK